MTDGATQRLACALHREEVSKTLVAWFETAKTRGNEGGPSVYMKHNFQRLAQAIAAASRADQMIGAHINTVMTESPVLAAALWMEIGKLINAVYEIGGLSEISASEERLVEWSHTKHRQSKNGAKQGRVMSELTDKGWRDRALEFAKEYVAANPRYKNTDLADHIIKSFGKKSSIPEKRRFCEHVIPGWTKNGVLAKSE